MSDVQSGDDDDSLFKSQFYFDLKGAFKEARSEFGGSDNKAKALASAKLAGKALANTGVFATKLGVEILKRAPSAIARQAEGHLKSNDNLSSEQRDKLQGIASRAREQHDRMQEVGQRFHEFQKPNPKDDAQEK